MLPVFVAVCAYSLGVRVGIKGKNLMLSLRKWMFGGFAFGVILVIFLLGVVAPLSEASGDGSKGLAFTFGLLSFPFGLILMLSFDPIVDRVPSLIYSIIMLCILPLQWTLNGAFAYWLLRRLRK